MKQYCRYCMFAIDYDGSLICQANAPCGKNGSGKCYDIEKAKRMNKCKHFEFNSNDLLGALENGNFRQYKPREAYESKELTGQTVIKLM